MGSTRGISRIAVSEGDRQLRRSCHKFGEEFRDIRLRAGVSQAEVARAIGIARSVVCRLEQGDPSISPRIRARAGSALGADFRIGIYPAGAAVIHDAAHARIVEMILRRRHPSWTATVEAPVPGPGRRSTDIRMDRDRDIVLMEVETHVHALEAIIREGTEKRMALANAVSDRRIHVVLVLPPTRHHRALVRAHPAIVATAFPAHDADLARSLSNGSAWPGDGILWAEDTR